MIFMRCILFFDLPTTTTSEIKAYTKFRKSLINNGFIMIQESVYVKLAVSLNTMNLTLERIKKELPKKGLVQSLIVTEKQYASIKYLIGEQKNEYLNTDERLVVF